MPEEAINEYDVNLTPDEKARLQAHQTSLRNALHGHALFGRFRWTAKHDPSDRTIYVLERVSDGSMLAFYSADELARFDEDQFARDIITGRRTAYSAALRPRSRYFEHLSSSHRTDIVNLRQDTALLVPRAVLKVIQYSAFTPSSLMPTHVETPPTSILSEQDASRIAFHSPPSLEGAWQILYVATYVNGGRIFYRDIDTELVEAVFRFYGEAPGNEANQAG